MVYADQLGPGEHILAADAQILLQSLLLAVGKFQEEFIRGHSLVQIYALEVLKAVWQRVLGTFLGHEGQIEIVAVEMDEVAVHFGELKERLQQLGLLLIVFRHPLYGMPFSAPVVGTAYQVQIGGFGGEAGGFDI